MTWTMHINQVTHGISPPSRPHQYDPINTHNYACILRFIFGSCCILYILIISRISLWLIYIFSRMFLLYTSKLEKQTHKTIWDKFTACETSCFFKQLFIYISERSKITSLRIKKTCPDQNNTHSSRTTEIHDVPT